MARLKLEGNQGRSSKQCLLSPRLTVVLFVSSQYVCLARSELAHDLRASSSSWEANCILLAHNTS